MSKDEGTMTWTFGQLIDALTEYGRHLEGRELQAITVDSYMRYARWFLEWAVGRWAPRGRALRSSPRSLTAPADDLLLRADLEAYASYLAESHKPGAVTTYRHEAGMFIDWRYGKAGRNRATPLPVGPDGAARTARPITAPPPPDAGGWPGEASVQSSVVAWLVQQGWRITRVADTQAREHGVDITAVRGTHRLLIEVKGHPSERYATGERAGERRRWDPNAQARTYFGDALLALLRMRDANDGALICLAVPDKKTFTGLIDQVEASLMQLAILVLVVAQDGSVAVRLDPRP